MGVQKHLLAHLAEPAVIAAQAAWERHLATCEQCQRAPGPPRPDTPPADSARYACPTGTALHEEYVLAAHEAYRAAHPE